MTWTAYVFAVGGQFQAVLSMLAFTLVLAAVLVAGPGAAGATADNARRLYWLAAAAGAVGVLCALLAAAIPGRDEVRDATKLAHDLMCQPGGSCP